MKKILITAILTAALVLGALNYHFILFDDGVKVLRKYEMTFEDTFIDARGAKKVKLLFKSSLLKAGVRDLLKE